MSLAVAGVGKRFSGDAVLDRIDLEVASAELLCVVGPTGSGKSTLLRLIAGLEQPDSGRIRIGGDDVTALPPARRNVGMVFQDAGLFPHLDVRANLGFGLRVRREPERHARVVGVADRLSLTDLLERSPGTLSGGERQRVALGRALVRDPSVLLLDEPLQALDPTTRIGMRTEVQRVQRDTHLTTVWVTHDQDEALAVGDRVAVLAGGEILQVGTPREVYELPATVFVARFCGRDPMNVLDDEDGSIGFRAEDAHLGPPSADLRVDGRVVQVSYRGGDHLVTVETPRGPVTVRTADPPPVEAAATVNVPGSRVHRFGPDGRRR